MAELFGILIIAIMLALGACASSPGQGDSLRGSPITATDHSTVTYTVHVHIEGASTAGAATATVSPDVTIPVSALPKL